MEQVGNRTAEVKLWTKWVTGLQEPWSQLQSRLQSFSSIRPGHREDVQRGWFLGRIGDFFSSVQIGRLTGPQRP